MSEVICFLQPWPDPTFGQWGLAGRPCLDPLVAANYTKQMEQSVNMWEIKWQRTTLLVCWTVCWTTELVLLTTSDNTGNFHPVSQPSLVSASLSCIKYVSTGSAAVTEGVSSTLPWRTISWLTTVSELSNSTDTVHIHNSAEFVIYLGTMVWVLTKK